MAEGEAGPAGAGGDSRPATTGVVISPLLVECPLFLLNPSPRPPKRDVLFELETLELSRPAAAEGPGEPGERAALDEGLAGGKGILNELLRLSLVGVADPSPVEFPLLPREVALAPCVLMALDMAR